MGKEFSSMENMAVDKLFSGIYKGRRVFITGHTGFKGSWLTFWLIQLGAIVKGYSLAPDTNPSHWDLLSLNIESVYADIRDREKLTEEICKFKPEIIFHLAAQPLVRVSYENPFDTYEINIIGTLNLFEACRQCRSVKAIINVTSDKCYENREWIYGYRENDALGGFDPYSSSKACSEILTSSYRNSFFNISEFGKTHNALLASARAGNVIGGGDWAMDRLIPDIVKAVNKNVTVEIRNPDATRPWQHVLEPLSGYLLLGKKLLEGNAEYARAFNLGPDDEGIHTVRDITEILKNKWDSIRIKYGSGNDPRHEASLLKLDCSLAHEMLQWFPVWDINEMLEHTVTWYRKYKENSGISTADDLGSFIESARKKALSWTR